MFTFRIIDDTTERVFAWIINVAPNVYIVNCTRTCCHYQIKNKMQATVRLLNIQVLCRDWILCAFANKNSIIWNNLLFNWPNHDLLLTQFVMQNSLDICCCCWFEYYFVWKYVILLRLLFLPINFLLVQLNLSTSESQDIHFLHYPEVNLGEKNLNVVFSIVHHSEFFRYWASYWALLGSTVQTFMNGDDIII